MFYFAVDACPTMKEISQYVIPNYSSHWKALGILLGLSSGTLDIMTINHVSDPESCKSMLQKWLDVDSTPSWEKLSKAIKGLE